MFLNFESASFHLVFSFCKAYFFNFLRKNPSRVFRPRFRGFLSPLFGTVVLRLSGAFCRLRIDFYDRLLGDVRALVFLCLFSPNFRAFRHAGIFRHALQKKQKRRGVFCSAPANFRENRSAIRAILRYPRHWAFRFCSKTCRRRFCAIPLLYRPAAWDRRLSRSLRRSWV